MKWPKRAGALALMALGCRCPVATSTPPRAEANESPSEVGMLRQRGRVILKTRDARELKLEVEIASDDRTRARGLMFRKSMPEMSGMVFVFPDDAPRTFWMKNTYLALDMLFADSSGRIIGVVENAEPLTTSPRGVPGNARYVLEVNAGWTARHGISAGDSLTIEGMYQLQ